MDILFFIGALIAEIAGTIAWFGSSSIFAPIANQFLTFHNALIIIAIYHIFGNVSRFSLFYKHWDRRVFMLFGIPSIIATVIGARLASMIDPGLLKMILGIVLMCFAWYSMIRPSPPHITHPWVSRLWWALSGFSAGLIGTGGVLRWAFMTMLWLRKEAYIATIASVALLVDMTRIPIYFGQWFLNPQHAWMIPILLVIAFVWSMIGKYIVKRISTSLLTTIILRAIMIVSWLLAYQWAYQFFITAKSLA